MACDEHTLFSEHVAFTERLALLTSSATPLAALDEHVDWLSAVVRARACALVAHALLPAAC